MENKKKLNPNS